MLFKFQMDSSFHSCHVNRSSSLKYILSRVYTELQEPTLTPGPAFIVPPAAVSQHGTLKAALANSSLFPSSSFLASSMFNSNVLGFFPPFPLLSSFLWLVLGRQSLDQAVKLIAPSKVPIQSRLKKESDIREGNRKTNRTGEVLIRIDSCLVQNNRK